MCHGWDRGTRGRGRRRLARRSQRLRILSTNIPFAQDANRDSRGRELHEEGGIVMTEFVCGHIMNLAPPIMLSINVCAV